MTDGNCRRRCKCGYFPRVWRRPSTIQSYHVVVVVVGLLPLPLCRLLLKLYPVVMTTTITITMRRQRTCTSNDETFLCRRLKAHRTKSTTSWLRNSRYRCHYILQLLRLRRYERKSIEICRFRRRGTGSVWPKISGRKGCPYQPFLCWKTGMIDLHMVGPIRKWA